MSQVLFKIEILAGYSPIKTRGAVMVGMALYTLGIYMLHQEIGLLAYRGSFQVYLCLSYVSLNT